MLHYQLIHTCRILMILQKRQLHYRGTKAQDQELQQIEDMADCPHLVTEPRTDSTQQATVGQTSAVA